MSDPEKILQLPFEIMWPLAAGYLAYRLAFVGRDAPHKQLDTVFMIFVFGTAAKLLAGASGAQAPSWSYYVWACLGGVFSICLALVWRAWGAGMYFDAVRKSKILDHDGQPDVWRSMLARRLAGPVQLSVTTKSGKVYFCEELAAYNDAPLGPCLFGEDGSVAMYITSWRKVGEPGWRDVSPKREGFGLEMSFFKASEIERIDVTRGP